MNGSVTRLIIIVVGLSLATATIFTAITLSHEQKAFTYIPEDSQFISHFSYHNGSYYVFAKNNSYGIITETPYLQIQSAISSMRGNNNTLNISISTAMTYHSYTIFLINQISISQIMSIFGLSGLNLNVPIILKNMSLYVTDLTTKYSIAGNLPGVLSSINASIHKHWFRTFGSYIDENTPMSSAFFLNMNGIKATASVNMTMHTTSISLYSSAALNFTGYVNLTSIPLMINKFSNHSAIIELGYGFTDLQLVLENVLGTIEQFGGFNVQNNTGIPLLL